MALLCSKHEPKSGVLGFAIFVLLFKSFLFIVRPFIILLLLSWESFHRSRLLQGPSSELGIPKLSLAVIWGG